MTAPSPEMKSVGLSRRLLSVLADAQSVNEARTRGLRELATAFASPLGVWWSLDQDTGLLRWEDDWSAAGDLDEFRRICRRLTFTPGVGLPGRVLQTRAVAWVSDASADGNFPRAKAALAAGLRSAIAVPVVAGDRLLGVIELFRQSTGAPSEDQRDDLGATGLQIGAYLGQLRTEDQLRDIQESSASIVHAALDCVITMDDGGRILDFNPAAEQTFGYRRDEVVGDLLADRIIPREFRDAHREALTTYVAHGRPTILDRRLELVGLRADGSSFPVELTVTRLGTRDPPVFAGFIRDITERKDAETRLSRLLEAERSGRARAVQAERAAREVAEALQRSLLPPRLPAIPGLELDAVYRSGTEGSLVGGDFYDVFQLGPDRWGVVIGDVCGKGIQAASMTTMVRYAIRAAAVREVSPSAVLRVLSASLLGDDDHGQFCTAVYAAVDVGGTRPMVRMAVGGHPLPLLRDSQGIVSPVGRPGQLLGVIDAPRIDDVEFELSPGELLLLYTDGVTETHTPDGLFGETRLAALLSECGDLPPGAVAARIRDAVVASAADRVADDVAVLAVRVARSG